MLLHIGHLKYIRALSIKQRCRILVRFLIKFFLLFLPSFRAMAGNTSLSENYTFSGMFHIFDQHADSGKFLVFL